MKQLLAMLLSALLAFSCSACAQRQTDDAPSYTDNAETIDVDALLEELTSAAPVTEPTAEPVGVCYVLNTNTKRFHMPDCDAVSDMKEKNKQAFTGSREDVLLMGYQPCQRCHP